MTILQMRHFQAVCAHESITKAADSLYITQPAVSRSVKELEAELNINLLHRRGKRLKPTKEGEYFLEKADAILKQIDSLTNKMIEMSDKKRRILVGVPPMIGAFLFPVVFDAFIGAHPDVEIEIYEQGSLGTKQMVQDNNLDMAIAVVEPSGDQELHRIKILETELRFCVHKSHLLTKTDEISIEMLKDQPLIMFKDDFYQNAVISGMFAKAGIKPKIVLYSSHLYTTNKLILKGRAGAFLFKEIADMEPGIIGIPLKEKLPIDICLIWRKNKIICKDAMKFINFVKKLSIPQ